jgi:hypothetical protein
VDDDPRACYFKQVLNAKYMRMALILKLLEEAKKNPRRESLIREDAEHPLIFGGVACQNPRCISGVEQELPHIFKLTDPENRICRCIYCDTKEFLKD